MNVQDLALAIGALGVVLTDYGVDPATQEDIMRRFSRRLVEETIAAVDARLAAPSPPLYARH